LYDRAKRRKVPGIFDGGEHSFWPGHLLQELEHLRLRVGKERLVGMIGIGRTLQTPHERYQLGSRMVAKDGLVLCA
jgi:hypothetical protein